MGNLHKRGITVPRCNPGWLPAEVTCRRTHYSKTMQTIPSRPQTYRPVSIALHWIMLLLLLAVYAAIELKGLFPSDGDPSQILKTLHAMLGLSVLALVLLRIVLRLTGQRPCIVPEPSNVQKIVSRVMHASLYVFMLAMPLAGWLCLSAQGQAMPFLGMELPALMGADPHAADVLEEAHETLGIAGYYVIALHAMAALYHHFILKDNTLVRMLPRPR